jgi:hypothetical protein
VVTDVLVAKVKKSCKSGLPCKIQMFKRQTLYYVMKKLSPLHILPQPNKYNYLYSQLVNRLIQVATLSYAHPFIVVSSLIIGIYCLLFLSGCGDIKKIFVKLSVKQAYKILQNTTNTPHPLSDIYRPGFACGRIKSDVNFLSGCNPKLL